MPTPIPGIHHVTAVASDPGQNLEFYTDVLGLRLVKRSVNQDDVSVYHLFYGDHAGSPGTSMTFFPYPNANPGQVGTGQVSTTQFLVPAESIQYWTDRLADVNVEVDGPFDRLGDTVLRFRDPDGLPLELVGRRDVPAGNPARGPVPAKHGIRGFFGVTLSITDGDNLISLLQTMGYEALSGSGESRDRQRFEADGELGAVLDVVTDRDAPRGRPGAGTIHHVAFQVTSDEQAEWRTVLQEDGLQPTEPIDRKWFTSVYARTQAGILFEFATKKPGYTVDEDVESLGEKLVLPERLEARREEIEAGLPDLPDSRATK